jgi:F420-non-reducing hydrogenase iron-sulfur subunit
MSETTITPAPTPAPAPTPTPAPAPAPAPTGAAGAKPADWDPRIIAFCCNWCSYAGADLAGVSRVQMPTSFRVVRFMCSGRMDPALAVQLLREGMDGVIVLGCHLGDCHYIEGNFFAEIKMHWAFELLKRTELSDSRLLLDWVSASEGQRFGQLMTSFVNRIKALGPNPINSPDKQEMRDQLDAAIRTLGDFRLRALMSKVRIMRNDGNVYGEPADKEYIDQLVGNAMESEYLRNSILVAGKRQDWTVPQLADKLKRPSEEIMKQVVRLRQKNLLTLSRIEGLDPYYKTMGGV